MAWLKWGVFFCYKTILFDLKMHDEICLKYFSSFAAVKLAKKKWKKKTNFLIIQDTFSQFDSWKRNRNKYSLKNICRFGIQDWGNYLMNSLKVSKSCINIFKKCKCSKVLFIFRCSKIGKKKWGQSFVKQSLLTFNEFIR